MVTAEPWAIALASFGLAFAAAFLVNRWFWRPFETTFEVRRVDLWSGHEGFQGAEVELCKSLAQLSPHFLIARLVNLSGEPIGQPLAIVDLGTSRYPAARFGDSGNDFGWIDLVVAIAISPELGSSPTWLQIESNNFPPDWRDLEGSDLRKLPEFFPGKKPLNLIQRLLAPCQNVAIGKQGTATLELSGREFRQKKNLKLGFDADGVPFVERRRRWFSLRTRLAPPPDPPRSVVRPAPGQPPVSSPRPDPGRLTADPSDQRREPESAP